VIDADPERGELELELAGMRYRLRPSHQAIRAIERKTSFSLLELVRLGNAHALSMDHVGIVSAELIRAGAAPEDAATRAVHEDRISELVFEEGVVKVTARVTLCLAEAANGGRTATGEAKAAPAMKTGVAGAA
jgi:hypothetical protein